MRKIIVAALAVLVLAGCASKPPPAPHREEEWHSPLTILRKYADKDGKLTRAELEAGLKKDFDAADTNHDGVLEPDEVRAVDEARSLEDQSAASPLIDWKGQGFVDFDEFAETARSLFEQLDVDGNGVLTPQELNPLGPPAKQSGEQLQQGEHDHRGRGGEGGQNGNPNGGQGGNPDGGQGSGQ